MNHKLKKIAAMISVAFCIDSLADTVYRTLDPFISYWPQVGIAGEHASWNDACRAAAGSDCQDVGGDIICYENPLGAFSSEYGPGCNFDLHYQIAGTTTKVFAQNWALPAISCPVNWTYDAVSQKCVIGSSNTSNKACPTGNPVYAANGSKLHTKNLISINSMGIDNPLNLRYISFSMAPYQLHMGLGWSFDVWSRRIDFKSIGAQKYAYAIKDGGIVEVFTSAGNGAWSSTETIRSELKSDGEGFLIIDRGNNLYEKYDKDGMLLSIANSSGDTHSVAYKTVPGVDSILQKRIDEITLSNQRKIYFNYAPAGRLSAVRLDDDSDIKFDYISSDQPFLSKIIHSDGTYQSFLYQSEKSAILNNYINRVSWLYNGKEVQRYVNDISIMPSAIMQLGVESYQSTLSIDGMSVASLTGLADELGNEWASYIYDENGRVTSTSRAGNSSSISYEYDSISAQTKITGPNSGSRIDSFITVNGGIYLSGRSQPAGAGCLASDSSLTYDAQGNISSKTDFNGNHYVYTYDLSRNLETQMVQSGGQADTRTTSTKWHPDWRLESRVAQPGKITTLVYNGQPDPTAGNAVVSCAPASALLPDGKPIAVLCKKVERATTDANGAAGFAATLQSGVAARTWTWTYNQYGQVLTEDGPRTDVSDVTTYTYHPATAFTGTGTSATGVTRGDLASITNAAGKVTQYTQYNKHGQLLESIDPNGVVSSFTYDLRQRLLSSTVGGQTTSYTYDPVGQLKRITRPDASWVGYDYDPAHRQIAAYDNLGNRVDYTLDNAGNKVAESVKDPAGVLKRQLARSMDALGRVQQTTGRE